MKRILLFSLTCLMAGQTVRAADEPEIPRIEGTDWYAFGTGAATRLGAAAVSTVLGYMITNKKARKSLAGVATVVAGADAVRLGKIAAEGDSKTRERILRYLSERDALIDSLLHFSSQMSGPEFATSVRDNKEILEEVKQEQQKMLQSETKVANSFYPGGYGNAYHFRAPFLIQDPFHTRTEYEETIASDWFNNHPTTKLNAALTSYVDKELSERSQDILDRAAGQGEKAPFDLQHFEESPLFDTIKSVREGNISRYTGSPSYSFPREIHYIPCPHNITFDSRSLSPVPGLARISNLLAQQEAEADARVYYALEDDKEDRSSARGAQAADIAIALAAAAYAALG